MSWISSVLVVSWLLLLAMPSTNQKSGKMIGKMHGFPLRSGGVNEKRNGKARSLPKMKRGGKKKRNKVNNLLKLFVLGSVQ